MERDFIRAEGEGELREFDASELTDVDTAKQVGDLLCQYYPDHPWVITVQGGAIIVRHLSIASEVYRVIGKEGFGSILPPKNRTYGQLRRSVIEFGGQMLEAFKLPRGKWDGTTPQVPNAWTRGKNSGFT